MPSVSFRMAGFHLMSAPATVMDGIMVLAEQRLRLTFYQIFSALETAFTKLLVQKALSSEPVWLLGLV